VGDLAVLQAAWTSTQKPTAKHQGSDKNVGPTYPARQRRTPPTPLKASPRSLRRPWLSGGRGRCRYLHSSAFSPSPSSTSISAAGIASGPAAAPGGFADGKTVGPVVSGRDRRVCRAGGAAVFGVDPLGFLELVLEDDDAAGGLDGSALVDEFPGAGRDAQLVARVAAVTAQSASPAVAVPHIPLHGAHSVTCTHVHGNRRGVLEGQVRRHRVQRLSAPRPLPVGAGLGVQGRPQRG
jgi:hypothetical protein